MQKSDVAAMAEFYGRDSINRKNRDRVGGHQFITWFDHKASNANGGNQWKKIQKKKDRKGHKKALKEALFDYYDDFIEDQIELDRLEREDQEFWESKLQDEFYDDHYDPDWDYEYGYDDYDYDGYDYDYDSHYYGDHRHTDWSIRDILDDHIDGRISTDEAIKKIQNLI